MIKGRIEIAPGALRPTTPGTWEMAEAKLDEAERGILEMKSARTRTDFTHGWIRFVDSIEEAFTRIFKDGCVRFTAFQPWIGSIDAERKADELLGYIYQARHQSQHGGLALMWGDPGVQLAVGFNGTIKNIRILPDGTFEADATPLAGAPNAFGIVYFTGEAALGVIENRKHKQRFPAPTTHLGNAQGTISPVAAANFGLVYYRSVISRAKDKFENQK
jgi:hypothetical protein